MGQWLVWSDSSQEKGGQRVLRMTLAKMKARMANFLMPTAGKSRENWGERERQGPRAKFHFLEREKAVPQI